MERIKRGEDFATNRLGMRGCFGPLANAYSGGVEASLGHFHTIFLWRSCLSKLYRSG